ncbi:MAG TPA: Asp23/Gls24 family envelope stress response protein [Ktedonobacterales bacterium]|nr:Asp23/Gls24 family envelope stress response protein [Ktedonobacterales bacterium]
MPNGISSDQTSAKRQAIHANANAPNDIVAPGAWQGKIEVSPRAIATVAGRAVAECYGVVGIAARRARFGVVELLAPEDYRQGVEVRFTADHIAIEVYVVLEHGLRITEIAHNIMQNVKFAVERTLGLRVVRINVNVLALRVNGRA